MTEAQLSKGQQRALDDALLLKNIFITGGGGVGKSFLIRKIKAELENMGRKVALTSSTGISAVNIGGITIHSFCGTGALSSINEIKKLPKDSLMKSRVFCGMYETIIIDEVSMLSGDYIDMIDFRFQAIYKNDRPFGGRQVIFLGDFLQLPPVITQESKVEYHFAFESESWRTYGIREHFLTKCFRQEDEKLVYYLNCIRFGKISDDVLAYFNSRVGMSINDTEPPELFPLKSSVTSINFARLNKIKKEEHEYEAKFEGDDIWQQSIAKSTIAETVLYLKVGAQVLFIKNNAAMGYYNGMKGVVKECGVNHVIVETLDGEEIRVTPEKWEKIGRKGEVLASMIQIPLILGWAITIHKSQGMSLEYMKCDLSLCFESGQAYVALSRMKSMEGLSIIKPIKRRDIKTNKKIVDYYRNLMNKIINKKEEVTP